jgi:3-hydroxyacyl-CoA dehydrogenase
MSFKKIVLIGGGVLGSQIAYQTAYCGFDVTIWMRSEGSIGRTQPKLDKLHETYAQTINMMDTPQGKSPLLWARGIADQDSFNKEECLAKSDKAYKSIKLELDLEKALKDADLVIEAMSENVEQKRAFYKKAAPLFDEKTIVVTNSSTLLPSMFADDTGRPEKYLALHFANSIWKNNTAEVMVQPKTDMKYFEDVIEFARDIRMIPLPLKKEKSGYLLNSLLVPLLDAAMDLLVTGVSDPASIDTAWKVGTGAPVGPFEILDIVGLNTAYEISAMAASQPDRKIPYNYKEIAAMLKQMIDEGKTGKAAGEGFYKYPEK